MAMKMISVESIVEDSSSSAFTETEEEISHMLFSLANIFAKDDEDVDVFNSSQRRSVSVAFKQRRKQRGSRVQGRWQGSCNSFTGYANDSVTQNSSSFEFSIDRKERAFESCVDSLELQESIEESVESRERTSSKYQRYQDQEQSSSTRIGLSADLCNKSLNLRNSCYRIYSTYLTNRKIRLSRSLSVSKQNGPTRNNNVDEETIGDLKQSKRNLNEPKGSHFETVACGRTKVDNHGLDNHSSKLHNSIRAPSKGRIQQANDKEEDVGTCNSSPTLASRSCSMGQLPERSTESIFTSQVLVGDDCDAIGFSTFLEKDVDYQCFNGRSFSFSFGSPKKTERKKNLIQKKLFDVCNGGDTAPCLPARSRSPPHKKRTPPMQTRG